MVGLCILYVKQLHYKDFITFLGRVIPFAIVDT